MQDQVFSFIKQGAKSIKERELLLIIYCVPSLFGRCVKKLCGSSDIELATNYWVDPGFFY